MNEKNDSFIASVVRIVAQFAILVVLFLFIFFPVQFLSTMSVASVLGILGFDMSGTIGFNVNLVIAILSTLVISFLFSRKIVKFIFKKRRKT